MKTIYIADDGKEFDDEYKCKDYEFEQGLQNINSVEFYDSNGEMLNNPLSLETYNEVYLISVHSENELKELHDLGDYCDFNAYSTITDIGTWVLDERTYDFIKLPEKTFFRIISDKYVEKLKECHETNEANDILCELLRELGYNEIINEYNNI